MKKLVVIFVLVLTSVSISSAYGRKYQKHRNAQPKIDTIAMLLKRIDALEKAKKRQATSFKKLYDHVQIGDNNFNNLQANINKSNRDLADSIKKIRDHVIGKRVIDTVKKTLTVIVKGMPIKKDTTLIRPHFVYGIDQRLDSKANQSDVTFYATIVLGMVIFLGLLCFLYIRKAKKESYKD